MTRPPGLKVHRNLLDSGQVDAILAQQDFVNPDSKAHDLFRLYGDFGGKEAQDPREWMLAHGRQLQSQGFFPSLPNQYRVCDWVGGLSAQFKWHVDNHRHGEKILVISLTDQRTLAFRKPGTSGVYELMLDRGDAYIIQGAARWSWQHKVCPSGAHKSGGKSFVMSLKN